MIDIDTFEKSASRMKIRFSDEDSKARAYDKFSELFDFISDVKDVDISDVKDEDILTEHTTPLREDIAKKNENINADILAQNKHSVGNFFGVPKIIE